MKKLTFIFLFSAVNILFAQQSLFEKIKIEVNKQYPEIKLENKIIVVNAWSVNDAKSREANKEIDKAINTFGYAKLKGGSKGVVGILINIDEDKKLEEITLKKDKAVHTIMIPKGMLDVSGLSTIVFDSEGKKIYNGLEPNLIFSSIHNLITR
ncbi:MAG: hypothetical protein ACXVDC_15975 [Bacteroidia bacterium]